MTELIYKTWDSTFFGFPVGSLLVDDEVETAKLNELLIKAKEQFRLLYLVTSERDQVNLNGFTKNVSYIDERIIFEKEVDSKVNKPDNSVIEFTKEEEPTSLYKLAFESGKYSRFKMDGHFTKDQFEKLYCMMVDNAMQKNYADKIFVKKSESIEGFVTVKKVKEHLNIGLIGVAPEFQGTGVGYRLMNRVEIYAAEIEAKKISVLTQKLNEDAIRFYKKNGFLEASHECIFHLWF
jgi:dTDP-4-amino-4,6-dideoxy-D-galactose acyltransferase